MTKAQDKAAERAIGSVFDQSLVIAEENKTALTSVSPVAATQLDLFGSLAATATVIDGHDLVNKPELEGMPFVITGVTFRDGIMRKAAQGNKMVDVPSNYVSVEIVIGNSEAIHKARARAKISAEQASFFEPNERVVINDGSTGICRQMLAYLSSKNLVTLPDGREDGGAGESRYDTYRADWTAHHGKVQGDDAAGDVHFDLMASGDHLLCPRGLRKSEYDAAGQQSTTYYLA